MSALLTRAALKSVAVKPNDYGDLPLKNNRFLRFSYLTLSIFRSDSECIEAMKTP